METILVIDDELFMRRLCDDMLSLRGFKVLTAESAKEGLAKLEQGGVDVILLDIMMPEMTGLELLPLLKKADPDAYVIIITAYASLDNALEALKKGAYDYIRKPFRPHELYHSVDKAIGRRRVDQENKRLLHDLQLKVKELTTLNRVGQYIHSLIDIDRLLEKIVLSIAAVMGVEIVSLMSLDRETGDLTIKAAVGLPEEVIRRTRQKIGTGIAGWVAEKGEPLLIQDIEKDPRFDRLTSDPIYVTKSLLSVPLLSKQGVLGVLNVNRKSSGEAFTEYDSQLLTTFSAQAAAAIENAALYERVQNFNRELEGKVHVATAELAKSNTELKRKVAELSTLCEASRVMTSTLNLRELSARMMDAVLPLIPHDLGEICVLDDDGKSLRVLSATQAGRRVAREGRYPLTPSTPAGWLGTERRQLLLRDLREDGKQGGAWVELERAGHRACVGTPLLKGDRLIGTFALASARPGAFDEGHLATLAALAGQLATSVENAKLYSDIQRNFIETMRSLVNATEARDEYTRNHSERVTRLALLVARTMGLNAQRLNTLRIAGALHDIGKIGLDDAILKSEHKLSPEQLALMREHPTIGARILDPIKFLRNVKEIVLRHQERYDGSGYPFGLAADAIPLEARILGVADAYDAMISKRRYRKKVFTHAEVLDELNRGSGHQFDPQIVAGLLQLSEAEIAACWPPAIAPRAPGVSAPAKAAPAAARAPAPRARPAVPAARPAAAPAAVVAVKCSSCGAAYRVDPGRFKGGVGRVKCAKCGSVFEVRLRTAGKAS